MTRLITRVFSPTGNKWYKFGSMAVAFALVAMLPLFLNNYTLNVVWTAASYMLPALGLNIIVGYCGLCDLGYSAKIAIGAYTTAILIGNGWDFWLTLPVSILVSILFAVIIGAPTLKLRSDYLAIVTLGFAEIVRIAARNLDITGKATGISAIPRPTLFGLHLTERSHWHFIYLLLVVLFIFISYRIKNSRFGRALAYIREDEDAAQAMGVDPSRYKLYAYMIGAVMGGIAGSFYAVKMTNIAPDYFSFTESANILLVVILGGMGKIPGVLAGATFFAVFPELFRDVPFIKDTRMLFFGLLLVIVMIFRPQGLWPDTLKLRRKTKKTGKNTPGEG